jgi:hypothetical protein
MPAAHEVMSASASATCRVTPVRSTVGPDGPFAVEVHIDACVPAGAIAYLIAGRVWGGAGQARRVTSTVTVMSPPAGPW